MLTWRSRVRENDRLFMVKGTELAVAIVPNANHRFQLCDTRIYVPEGRDGALVADREILVRDAESVSDEDVRKGIRPRIVARFMGVDEALAYCHSLENAEDDGELEGLPKADRNRAAA